MEQTNNENNKNQLSWSDIPAQYRSKINEIDDEVIQNIYSKFSFKYYEFKENQNCNNDNENFALFVFNYLIKYKFIIFHLTNDPNSNISSRTNCVICIEGECIIIDQIKKSLLDNIISKLHEKQISIINVGKNPNHKFDQIEIEAKEEIQKFYEHFFEKIKQNNFVSNTIDSIIGYLIRRFYLQSSYFKDPKFFYFDENGLIEHETKNKIYDCVYGENDENDTITKDLDEIRKLEDNFKKYEFNKNDFIKLRTLYTKTDSIIYLVIHIKSLHLFSMKKFVNPVQNDVNNYEINFSDYSHRCFVRCYGLITENDKTIGIIYEFMSNGNLDSYIKNKNNDAEDIFKFTTIIRIINGIEYLQKNQLIHRDLKPSNILIDHDYLPYISDFETVKSISTEKTNTNDIGSLFYSSPEQDGVLNVSYPTDIYSFGLIIYFLFEKKDMFEQFPYKKSNIEMTNGPSIMQYIYSKSVEYNPEQRIICSEIKTILNDIFYFYEKHFIGEKDNIDCTQLINFIFESKINQENNESLSFHHSQIQNSYYLGYFIYLYNLPKLFLNLGDLYAKGEGIKRDYSKAIEYYEKSAKLNNSDALSNLGSLYFKGEGVKQDYSKAIEYYKRSAKLNNSDALYNLGSLYFKGEGVKQDYSKAIEYYEKSTKLNNSHALNNLGVLYAEGEGVKRDYSKAIEYYKRSAKLNNSAALFNLGHLYAEGEGVKRDYSKAIEYYEKSAKLNNSTALNHLGFLYAEGEVVKQDYSKAIEYYERSAKLNNSTALNSLGFLYTEGEGVKQDYSKAIEYYEKSAKLNNSTALLNLGVLYFKGEGVKQDYSKAIEYYERSAKLNNPYALDYLGNLYESGFGVAKNYEKALNYYEKSAAFNNSDAFLRIGKFYFNGYGVNRNYSKAIQNYELSSYLNNSLSHFILGDIYSNSDVIESDFDKAIKYFQKSIGIQTGIKTTKFLNKESYIIYKTNNHRYISYNDIGLIYLIEKKELEKGIDNIKESAFAEYPFGQNNFGLINEFYLNEKGKAEYMYKRSSKHNFALAEFNLGRMLESENKTNESIEYFILASEHENEPLLYRKITREDKRLEISKKFIICLTNLKLFIHFYSKDDRDESKKYFNKAFNNLTLNSKDINYQFKFKIRNQQEYSNDLFSYLKKFIFNFPLFNLINQPNLDIKSYSDIFKQNKDENDYQIETTKANEKDENKREIKDPFIFDIENENDSNKQENKYENNFSSKIEGEKLSNKYSENKEKENNLYEKKQNLLINEIDTNKQNNENKKHKKFSIINSEYEFESDVHENKEKEKEGDYLTKDKEKYIKQLSETNEKKHNFKENKYLMNNEIEKINEQNKNDQSNENDRQNTNEHCEPEKEFEDPSELFDFVFSNSNSNSELKTILIKEIKNIIDIMIEILYTPPYPILFGHISIVKPKEKVESKQIAVDESFYDGFGIE